MRKVLMVYRKRNPRFFSIEAVFDRVRMGWEQVAPPLVIELPRYGISFINLMFLIKKRVEYGSALFHVTGDSHYSVVVLPRNRTILTIHDCVFLEQHQGLKRWILKSIMLSIPLWFVKYVTTISEKTKEEIVLHTGCDPQKIRVIPNPVSPMFYFLEKDFNSECPLLLFIGVTPNKNLERACMAIEDLPCLLRVIGKLTEEQVRMLNELNITYQTVSGISDKAMADEYAHADIIFFPSLYEGFGLPIIEGFKAGRAVLTSDISPMKEIAGNAACLVDPTDVESIRTGLLRIISDQSYRELNIRNGFEVVKKFDHRAIALRYSEFYEEVYDSQS